MNPKSPSTEPIYAKEALTRAVHVATEYAYTPGPLYILNLRFYILYPI